MDIDSVLSSSLSNTPWGVLDIWIRYSGKIDRHSLLEKIKETVDKSLLTPLFIHMYFESGHIEDEELLGPIRNSKLIPSCMNLRKGARQNLQNRNGYSLPYMVTGEIN